MFQRPKITCKKICFCEESFVNSAGCLIQYNFSALDNVDSLDTLAEGVQRVRLGKTLTNLSQATTIEFSIVFPLETGGLMWNSSLRRLDIGVESQTPFQDCVNWFY